MTAARAHRRKVVFLGLRGVPDIQGGVETHVAALAMRLVERGWDVEVIGRDRYLPPGGPRPWRGVVVTPLWAPRSTSAEALVHTFLGIFLAAARRPDVIHIHAIGPALLTPLARLFGLRVVVTHHGFDYDRQKWGAFAKAILHLGEWAGMRWSHARIAVSRPIAEAVSTRWTIRPAVIPNGVEIRCPAEGWSRLDALGLAPGRYVLIVARIVEEKRQLDLLAAFARLGKAGLKLAIVGGSEFESGYLRRVRAAAVAHPGVVMTGFRTGEDLAQLYAHAALFVLPSSHEGMPIALLEALGHGLPVLASDIAANLALELDPEDYFPLGDVDALASAMYRKLAKAEHPEPAPRKAAVAERGPGWDRVADRTLEIYEGVVGRRTIEEFGARTTPGQRQVRKAAS